MTIQVRICNRQRTHTGCQASRARKQLMRQGHSARVFDHGFVETNAPAGLVISLQLWIERDSRRHLSGDLVPVPTPLPNREVPGQ